MERRWRLWCRHSDHVHDVARAGVTGGEDHCFGSGGRASGVVEFGADGVVRLADFVVGDVVGGFGEMLEVAAGFGEEFAEGVERGLELLFGRTGGG